MLKLLWWNIKNRVHTTGMCQWYVDFMTEIINLGRSWSPSLRNGSGVQPTHQRVSLRSLQKPVRFCSLLGVTYLQKAMRSWCTPTLASWTVVTCAVSTSRRAAPASGAIWSYTTTQSSSVPSAAHASKVRAGYRWCESAYVVMRNRLSLHAELNPDADPDPGSKKQGCRSRQFLKFPAPAPAPDIVVIVKS